MLGFLLNLIFSLSMEISTDDRVELSIVEHSPPPSSHHNGDAGGVEVAMEEYHLWPTKDGPLPIFLKVSACGLSFFCRSLCFYHPDLKSK